MRALILCLALLAGTAQAAMSPIMASKVQEAWALYEADKLDQAIDILAPLEPRDGESKAYVARLLGSLYWAAEQPDKALEQLQIALDSGVLNEMTSAQTRRMVADILLMNERFRDALGHYLWLRDNAPAELVNADLQLRIAQSHFRLEQWAEVIPAARAAVALESSVSPYQMMLTAYQQLQNWPEALKVTAALIELEPERLSWWRQRASVQLRLNDQEAALRTLALAEQNNLLTSEGDYRSLIQLFNNRGLPELAARFLAGQLGKHIDDDVERRVELARYWQMAREWDAAQQAWGRAAELDSQYRVNQFEVLVMASEFRQAVALLPALDALKLDNDDRLRVEMMAVRAYYQMGDYPDALARAERARHYDRESADPWMAFLQEKLAL
ncbi:tetratricopeptide repeat protein [Ferrimonas balearica]|uniref:tetratricopeptide repeat protein n=1 Tax=Ferrimonas balearica TaxID=44012 RepID=UPI001C594867|nr:tetratricopeptide repeat protein [Ferrimonas balearica]MBW3163880.1 tetratricopeptide repeat protein [Ferrimonas balearica]